MKKLATLMAVACLGGLLAGAAPAYAGDLCLQYSGIPFCPLTGAGGFFRFTSAKLPTSAKKAVALRGRACGTGTVTGTAVQTATAVVLNATYTCAGAAPGLIEATFPIGANPVGTITGGRSGGDGYFDLSGNCMVAVVDCATEP